MRYLKSGIFFFLLFIHLNTFATRLAPPLDQQSNIPLKDAGAQTLYSIETITVEQDYHWQSQTYYSIRINDLEAARDYGRITVGYNHYYSELELEFANVLTPNGEIKSLKSDAMQERSAGSQDFYEDRTMLVFSLPEITPGSILEFQYKRKSKTLPMPGIFSNSSSAFWYQPTVGGYGGRVDPVNYATFEVTLPADMPLDKKNLGPIKGKHKATKSDTNITHQWRWQDLPAIAIESYMPSYDSVMSRVKVSTSRNWSDIDQWTWGLTQQKFASHPEIKKIAAEIASPEASRDEKIKAVYAYLQENIRYVFAHLGRGGYEPHFAHEVIQQRYGDCKDQTILAIALLRELGIEAVPSLVITLRNGQPDMELVALYFDHMIVWIPGEANAQGMWMDTTGDRVLFPGVSNYLQDQSALIINGEGGELTTIGQQLPENIGTLAMDYHTDSNGHLIVDVTIDSSGIYEQNLRNWWIHDSNRETSLQQLVMNIFPDAKSNATIKSKTENAENLWKPFTIVSQFDFGQAREEPGKPISVGVGIIQAYRVFGDFNSMQIPSERKNNWVNKQTKTLKINATMSGDKHDLPAVITSGIDVKNAFFTISQSGKQSDKHYQIDLSMEAAALDLSPNEYQQYYQSLSTLNEAGHWSVQFFNDKNRQKLTDLTENIDENDLQAQLKLARYYLEQGDFEAALKPANAALKIDRDNGESWYLLGLVQGYNALVEESMESFSQASKLGYIP
ncbi:DUF3857 domain-containing transglutaminase family protein [Oceanicoccus sp. KOV_DT_Chl]|uniref:DUF3857 domain-containing transglutaminase family protein n=1 Tax=Oceanicoccus sp. KOV_DT_Chl TaxID=1904639 RepID=UPI000C7DC9D5|nr:DUF3857 domain-containing protein [Oceanicoccus sp. KOV_DT_Chl]